MASIRRPVFLVLRVGLVLLALAPLIWAVGQRWPDVRDTFTTIQWPAYFLGQSGLILILPLLGVVSWLILRGLHHSIQFVLASGIFFLSQLMKYLPGGIWVFPGRIVAYQSVGVGRAQSVVSVFRELSVLFLSAASIGALAVLDGNRLAPGLRIGVLLGGLASILVLLILQTGWFWRMATSFRWLREISRAEEIQLMVSQGVRLGWIFPAYLTGLVFWMLVGIPFRQLAIAVHPDAIGLTWVQAAGLFALAWCAGFVVVFAPAGLGIRETVLSLLLARTVPPAEALSIALLARVWWMFGEAVWIVVALIWVTGNPEWSLERFRFGNPKADLERNALIDKSP